MSSQPAYVASAPYSAPAPVSKARSSLNLSAVFSLITAVLLLSPVAIVLGHIAIEHIRRRRQSGLVLAIIGLALGYIGLIGMIIALVSLLSFVNSGPVPPTSF